ncbi:two component transcriptional regulator, LuxR family [Arsukibacterium tuosuense]|uniref:Two component transcriptional regulator, LuxR family n=1 Tax=Arsukibacterium tuosuense TaxID=1323745 RepID=A0A285ID28_9GAMM|nr:response regulator [Arsukibacterium tuosuense]SNY45895.1 two component transcriptional regulator, LuxR family [Arsukibacterium tuosuense]
MPNINSKIYIVDDDELVLETLKNVLFCSGYTVKTYLTATTFLANVKDVQQGCLIVDLRMPEIDGLELQQRLRQQQIDLPVIFLSGAADIDSAVQAMASGAFTFLQKPVSNPVLLETIQTAIAQHHLKRTQAEPVKAARQALSALSERELAIARLAAEGLSATSIAEKLYISARTVEAHKASVFVKLNIKTVAQLTRLVVLANIAEQNT